MMQPSEPEAAVTAWCTAEYAHGEHVWTGYDRTAYRCPGPPAPSERPNAQPGIVTEAMLSAALAVKIPWRGGPDACVMNEASYPVFGTNFLTGEQMRILLEAALAAAGTESAAPPAIPDLKERMRLAYAQSLTAPTVEEAINVLTRAAAGSAVSAAPAMTDQSAEIIRLTKLAHYLSDVIYQPQTDEERAQRAKDIAEWVPPEEGK